MKKRELLFGITMSVKLDQCLKRRRRRRRCVVGVVVVVVVVVVIKFGSDVMLLKMID
jgi:hypothetical protein